MFLEHPLKQLLKPLEFLVPGNSMSGENQGDDFFVSELMPFVSSLHDFVRFLFINCIAIDNILSGGRTCQ